MLKQLRHFKALARHGHFGRAADACAISHPTLSVRIRELEESLGTGPRERGARQVRLANFAEASAARVRDILRSVDELGGLARASRDRLVRRLRIGVFPTIAPLKRHRCEVSPFFSRAGPRSENRPSPTAMMRRVWTPGGLLPWGRIGASVGAPKANSDAPPRAAQAMPTEAPAAPAQARTSCCQAMTRQPAPAREHANAIGRTLRSRASPRSLTVGLFTP